MNYKKWLCGIGTLTVCCILTGCCMSHEWKEATCSEPKTCTKCGETEGEALGHTWVDATCAEPKHCSVCGETEGATLEHTWVDATCLEPKHCSICGETEGNALEHTLTEAYYICEVCGETVGEPLQAYYEQNGIVCDAQLNTAYPYTAPCYVNKDYTTTGTVTFSDYEVFPSDDEGYEWQAVTVTFFFNDQNTLAYGATCLFSVDDYYTGLELESDSDSEKYTLNYNGVAYTECITDVALLQNSATQQGCTFQWRVSAHLPEKYDGCVVHIINETENEDTIYYRFK